MIVTLEEAKMHLRVDEEYDVDNKYIEDLIYMTEFAIANRIQYPTIEEAFPLSVPLPVKHAAKMFVSHFYENREPISFANPSPVPMTIDFLLDPYTRYYVPK